MAITAPTLVDSGTDTGTAQTGDLGAGFTPAVGDIVLVCASSTRGSSSMTGTAAITGHAGFSGAWTLINSHVTTNETANRKKVSWFWNIATSAVNDFLNFDTGESANNTSKQLLAYKVPGAHLTTPHVSGQVANAADVDSTDGAITATLGSALQTGSMSIASCHTGPASATEPTSPSGWTKLNYQTNTAPNSGLLVSYKLNGDQAAAFTGAAADSTADLAATILEIAAAAASGQVVIINHMRQQGAA